MSQRWTRCTDPSQSTWKILQGEGRAVIRFSPCGVESPHPDDIAQRYCAFCHEWIVREGSTGGVMVERIDRQRD